MISLDDVHDAARRIEGVVHRTPVLTSRTLDAMVGASVALKAENLQRAGSFKLRGAYNLISRLDDDERTRGVVAFSSGNHAQAVALAARTVGAGAVVAMPDDAPPEKRAAAASYGAEIVGYDRQRDDREEVAAAIARGRGATVVPPYEHPLIVAGQGTAALELIEDHGAIDVLVVPVGGGGLIAGCATAAKGLLDTVEVVGVEPELADDTRRSFEAGERVTIPPPPTIADGLRSTVPGELTFAINREHVDRIVTVSERAIVEAMRFAIDRLKLVVEPSGAVALAAVLDGAVAASGRRVGVILSGGNIASSRLATVLEDAP